MKTAKKDLQEWAKATIAAKVQELEAAMRFILRNQQYDGFFDADDDKNEGRGRQGRVYIEMDGETPVLYVNWDEVYAINEQEALFEELFEGDFSSNKVVRITGVKL